MALLVAAALVACEREERETRSLPPESERSGYVALSPLSPGSRAPIAARTAGGREYEENAFHINQGERLYSWFNCTGCHGNGGGGSGPALMDDVWIYGGDIDHIASTIREGRPAGMPSFGDMLPEEQIWQLAAYVRSLGGNVAPAAAPAREDGMHPDSSEQQQAPEEPQSGQDEP